MYKKWIKKRFERKMTEKKITQIIERIIKEEKEEVKNEGVESRFACVQREIKGINSLDDYVYSLYIFIKKAADNGAHYVIFPEYNFLDLVGLLPDHFLNKNFSKREEENGCYKNPYFLWEILSKPSERILLKVMKSFAEHFSLYIYTGTYIKKSADDFYNRGSLINPEGEIIGHQDKIHLTRFEEETGLSRGEDINVYRGANGKIALLTQEDASYFESFARIAQLEAEIAIVPMAKAEPYNEWKDLLDTWGRVQEYPMFGVRSSLNGSIGDFKFTGKAGIYAPLMITEKEDGILALAENETGDELVIADLDMDLLKEAKEKSAYSQDKNEIFEKNYYNEIYQKED